MHWNAWQTAQCVFLEKPQDGERTTGLGRAGRWSAEGNCSLIYMEMHSSDKLILESWGQMHLNTTTSVAQPRPGSHEIMIGQGLSPFYRKSRLKFMSLVNMMRHAARQDHKFKDQSYSLFEELLMESRPINSVYGNPSDSSLWSLWGQAEARLKPAESGQKGSAIYTAWGGDCGFSPSSSDPGMRCRSIWNMEC